MYVRMCMLTPVGVGTGGAPDMPMSGPGRGGRIGGAFNFTHHVMKSLTKDTTRGTPQQPIDTDTYRHRHI
jgi:hypothetical protein